MSAGATQLLGERDIDLLMELQYNFQISPDPIGDAARSVGLSPERAVERLKELAKAGIVKRIGFYYNYRAQGKTAALVAFAAGEKYRELANLFRGDPDVTHNYLRDHPVYNVWIVIKRPTREELLRAVDEAARKVGVDGWIALFSRRTYKLSVKYDLREGISRSGRYWRVEEKPPRPEDLGVDPMLPRLVRVLHLNLNPYRHAADRLGITVDEVLSQVKLLLDKGVLMDPGLALDGHKAGFTENAMVVMEPEGSGEETCERAAELPYSTHVVLRESYPPGAWRHICYFMVHATSKDRINMVLEEAREKCRPRDAMAIFSLEDLKPGYVR
ncbi:Lrp/AsnC family transcriptional regulator [Aeropyrum camini]|uniref:Transcriptional regulator n=1 Tax=Aeropyrum camini SY1 = JCM 12091 TaxID=1198449 RepID=U3TDA8_9CREN|nr:Lrp/AsnC family transcriptional regulator [Aeropyrum camini]BAN90411.1 transcriptional regulator [Aeropyrum camini SY1 = JCM 12091]